jgi:NAD(P)-dependent dehydrogenase (short-subunit alcohol dehydrogenase family)
MRQSRDEALSSWVLGAAVLGAAVAGTMIARSSRRESPFSFQDKAVLITGGSRGLGLEIARLLAREGAHISLVARNASTLESARNELDQLGHRVLVVPCDVRDQNEVERAVRETVNCFGRLDVLINNAGVIQVGPFESMTLADYEMAMQTHAWGSLYSIMAAVPHMRNGRGGRIVNVVSIGGRLGVPHLLPYVMSKFAQAGLSEALSAELAREGILVTSVYPGMMRTGSHVNALFKGDRRKEFAWFSIGASLPLVSINARRAARQILEACRSGAPETVITPAARLATMANGVLPGFIKRSMRLMNSLLPTANSNTDKVARPGWESRSSWSPSPLTRLADRVIERNNENRAVG